MKPEYKKSLVKLIRLITLNMVSNLEIAAFEKGNYQETLAHNNIYYDILFDLFKDSNGEDREMYREMLRDAIKDAEIYSELIDRTQTQQDKNTQEEK